MTPSRADSRHSLDQAQIAGFDLPPRRERHSERRVQHGRLGVFVSSLVRFMHAR
jgi:hypothetical protein